MKKLIALIMSFAMFTASAAFAAQPSDEVVNELVKYNIISDPSDLRPDDNITRAELVKILCEAACCDLEDYSAQPFTDVTPDHWAFRYISAGYMNNMISGYGDGTFRPEQNVTEGEIRTMIVSLLGYASRTEDMGEWPLGYLAYAKYLGVTDSTDVDVDAPVTRGEAMQMIYNALDAPMMELQTSYWFGEERSVIVVYDGKDQPLKTLRTILDAKK